MQADLRKGPLQYCKWSNFNNTSEEGEIVLNDEVLLKLIFIYPFLYDCETQPIKDSDYLQWAWECITRDFNEHYAKCGIKLSKPFDQQTLQQRWRDLMLFGKRCDKAEIEKTPLANLDVFSIICAKYYSGKKIPVRQLTRVETIVLDAISTVENLPKGELKSLEADIMQLILNHELEALSTGELNTHDVLRIEQECHDFLETIQVAQMLNSDSERKPNCAATGGATATITSPSAAAPPTTAVVAENGHATDNVPQPGDTPSPKPVGNRKMPQPCVVIEIKDEPLDADTDVASSNAVSAKENKTPVVMPTSKATINTAATASTLATPELAEKPRPASTVTTNSVTVSKKAKLSGLSAALAAVLAEPSNDRKKPEQSNALPKKIESSPVSTVPVEKIPKITETAVPSTKSNVLKRSASPSSPTAEIKDRISPSTAPKKDAADATAPPVMTKPEKRIRLSSSTQAKESISPETITDSCSSSIPSTKEPPINPPEVVKRVRKCVVRIKRMKLEDHNCVQNNNGPVDERTKSRRSRSAQQFLR